jgi:hypothetical protein
VHSDSNRNSTAQGAPGSGIYAGVRKKCAVTGEWRFRGTAVYLALRTLAGLSQCAQRVSCSVVLRFMQQMPGQIGISMRGQWSLCGRR